jgi:hypothetical protein
MSQHDNGKAATTQRKAAKTPRTPRPTKKTSPHAAGANNHRDAFGRFQAGNPGGYGNPYARQVAMLRRELMQVTAPADIREVGQKVLALAKAGNVQAAKLLFAYNLGLPMPPVDPDRVDIDERELFSHELEISHDGAKQITNAGLEVMLRYLRSRRLYNAYVQAKVLIGQLTATPEERARHQQETAHLPPDQRALRYADLGEAKHWLPCAQQELLHKPWEPWPARTPSDADATADIAAKNGAPKNGAPSEDGVNGAHAAAAPPAAGVPAAPVSAAPNSPQTPSVPGVVPNGSSARAPSGNGNNGSAHDAQRHSAQRNGANGSAHAAAPKKRIVAGSKRAILPKALRRRGEIVPCF